MVICPHCGAENADGSNFCSLCLASFAASSSVADNQQAANAPAAQQAQPYVSPGDYRALAREMDQSPQAGYGYSAPGPDHPQPHTQQQPYISPGDYRALAREMAQSPAAGYRDSAYYQAAMEHPGAVSRLKAPARIRQRSKLDIAIMLLAYSLAASSIIFALGIVISLATTGAAFGGSEESYTLGVITIYIMEALVLAIAGYAISAKAMHATRGWLYGAGCAAITIFVWLPLAFMIVIFLMTGDVYVPLFSLAGILIALFLFVPLGALGGWFAEKRYMG